MSQEQLDAVIADVQACFGAWDENTPMPQMRKDWDDVFTSHPGDVGARREAFEHEGLKGMRITAPGAEPDRAILYLHGGGYVFGSPLSHGVLCEYLSAAANAVVFALDYRLAPEHPFPGAVEDAVAAYRWLLESFSPKKLVIAGDSAGGGLSLATLVAIRDAELPAPACATLLSPWADLTCSGETMTTKAAEDPMVQRDFTQQLAQLYAPGDAAKQPLASPVNANLGALPPMLIQVGSRETLLDDSRRVAERARAAGVDVTLDIGDGMIHVYQIFAARLDEARTAIEGLGAFIRSHTS